MQFELTLALTKEIIFHMENQGGEFFFDALRLRVIPGSSVDDEGVEGRYIALPKWGPREGYRLRERFVAQLRGPTLQTELSAALEKKTGVFRAFNEALAARPEAKKLWRAHKDAALRGEVAAWHNALRESWGLQQIGEEPEDIAGIALEDFRFRDGVPEDEPLARALRDECEGERGGADVLSGMGEWAFPGELCCVAETASGDFAGYASSARGKDGALRICALEARAEYRGLGLGKQMLARLLERADELKIARVTIDLPEGQKYFSRALWREFFKPRAQRFSRDLPGQGLQEDNYDF
ncbi:MAG: GNAT family N-acetyltransferase [Treponema sp.]|nr:GNAT family N-acetyltransferase [Treponema sp.]